MKDGTIKFDKEMPLIITTEMILTEISRKLDVIIHLLGSEDLPISFDLLGNPYVKTGD